MRLSNGCVQLQRMPGERWRWDSVGPPAAQLRFHARPQTRWRWDSVGPPAAQLRFRPQPQTKPQPRASSEPGLRTRWRWDSVGPPAAQLRFRPRPQTKPQPRASSEPGLRTRWRWDSNPRWSCPHTRFRGVLLWPLGHATADNDTGVPRRPAGQDLSRSSMRACRVGRCCKAARTARCRPSSRYRSPSHRTTCAKRSP